MICDGAEDDGAALVASLRALGPEIDTVATVPAPALSRLHMDPEGPTPGRGEGLLLADVTAETIDALVSATVGSPLVSVEMRHLGGELARRRRENGAAAAIEGAFNMFAVGITPTPESIDAVVASVESVRGALRPWATGSAYLNFTEHNTDGSSFYPAETYARLRSVKAAYDPDDVIQSNHPIPPVRPKPRLRRLAPPQRRRT